MTDKKICPDCPGTGFNIHLGMVIPCGNPVHSQPEAAATTIAGFPVRINPTMPKDEIRIVGANGSSVAFKVRAK